MLDRAPSVVITSNRNELKVYQGNNVYLNNGDNFELRFFNPLNEKLGVEINFNGMKKGNGYLVLNPGQDIVLDRFLDEQRKMLFETYTVDGNNEEAVKAIEKNGIITFNFFKEYGSYMPKDVNINYAFPPKPRKYDANRYSKSMNYYNSGTSGNSGISGNSGTSGSCGTGGNGGFSTNNFNYTAPGVFFSEKDFSTSISNTMFSADLSRGISSTITNTVHIDKDYWFPSSSSNISAVLPTIDNLETGRIEMGEISKQQLKTINAQFCSTPIHTVTYQLLPISAMNRTISEVRQYCPECGYRLRKETWHFCPKCGEDLK